MAQRLDCTIIARGCFQVGRLGPGLTGRLGTGRRTRGGQITLQFGGAGCAAAGAGAPVEHGLCP
eukprot:1634274-Rhodomonas_salina.2